MARGLTTLPDEMINWIDHGKVIETMPTDDNSIQEMISGTLSQLRPLRQETIM